MRWGLENVRVSYGRRIALDGVTVPADPYRVTVVVGGDGAGKSTCLKALVGLLRPAGGTVRRPAKRHTGYVPATAGLYADLTVQENLNFYADSYELPAAQRGRVQDEILERIGLANARGRLGGQLSGGMQRKLAVGLALLHSPELLVLDEPTTGVDPVSRAELWRLISAAAAQGAAVAISTTYVNEAARATSVVLLEAGKVLASGSPDSILRSVPGAVGTAHREGTAARPTPLSWSRGVSWRVWAPTGELPDGVAPAVPDFDDAVVVAELADQTGR
jgi:ABC-type multidrug transport system ATPase subunit